MMITQPLRIGSCFGLFLKGTFQVTCFLSVLIAVAHPQDTEMRRSWSFASPGGNLSISLEVFNGANGRYVNRFLLEADSKRTWSTQREADALGQVFQELEGSKFPVRSGASILLRLNQEDAIAKLAVAAAGSATWRSRSKTGNSNLVNPAVLHLLNESGAYDPFIRTLASFNLTCSVVSVEKVFLQNFNASGAICPPSENCEKLRVPTDAMVQINIVPVATR